MFCLPMWLASHVRIPWELVRCRTPGLCTQPAWLTRHGGGTVQLFVVWEALL